jgi:hypothetical protein
VSRKIRVPKAQVGALPSPTWTYWLLIGRIPDNGIRLPGWPYEGFLWMPQHGGPGPADVWARHAEALSAEAQTAGFEPWWPTKKPSGPAVTKWTNAFCERHAY